MEAAAQDRTFNVMRYINFRFTHLVTYLELDGEKWSVAYVPPGATSRKKMVDAMYLPTLKAYTKELLCRQIRQAP